MTQPPTVPHVQVRQLDFHVGGGDETSVLVNQLLVQDVMEMGVLECGEAISLFGGRQYHLFAGQVQAHWGAMPHTAIWMAPGTRFIVAHIPLSWFLNWNLLPGFVEALLGGAHVSEQDTSPERQQLDLLLYRRWRNDSESNDETRHRICLDELRSRFERLAHTYAPTGTVGANEAIAARTKHIPAAFHQIITYVAANYTKPIQLADIATAVGVHPDHVSRVFSKVWGTSLGRYIARHQVLHAQRLLAISDLKIDEIAAQSGFGSVRQFFKIFREVTGVTPAAYRKNMEASSQIRTTP